jgi:hypothetical protein
MINQSMLIQKYIGSAVAQGEAIKIGEHKIANREYDKLTQIYRKLEKDRTWVPR